MRHYLGLYLFLQHEKHLSMVLDLQFRDSLRRNFNLTEEKLTESLKEVEGSLNLDISCLYLEFD